MKSARKSSLRSKSVKAYSGIRKATGLKVRSAVAKGKRLAKRIGRDPDVKEYVRKQKELAKETFDKLENRVKKKFGW